MPDKARKFSNTLGGELKTRGKITGIAPRKAVRVEQKLKAKSVGIRMELAKKTPTKRPTRKATINGRTAL